MKPNQKQWLKAAGMRAAKTVVQTAISTIGVTAYVDNINWQAVAAVSLLSGLLSILTSLAGLPEVNGEDPKENGEG